MPKTETKSIERSFLDDRLKLKMYPANLVSDGKTVGHIVITAYDPQKRSYDGCYPLGIKMRNATVISKSNNPNAKFDSRSANKIIPFLTKENELCINFIPEKNVEGSELFITTPWGDVEERLSYSTGLKHSISETLECMIYAFIIAIVFRFLFFSAFFIPSQSMENTLEIGDKIVANKIVYTFRQPKRQEVVIFKTYSPKERMARFHLEDSPHFDPLTNLRESSSYKDAEALIRAIVEPSFKGSIEIKDGSMFVENLCMGFPYTNDESGKLFVDDKFFANGTINGNEINLHDQFMGSLYITGNRLMLGDNNVDLGQLEVYYPLGNPGYVQFFKRQKPNKLVNAVKSGFFKLIGRRPQLLVGENQVIADLIYTEDGWTIFGHPLELNMNGRSLRFTLPFQPSGTDKIELGKLYVENGSIVLKDGEKIIRSFGKPVIRDDVAFINEQQLGYVRKTVDGFTINGLPLTDLWETRDFVKRCVAVPGDEIRILSGKVYINGEPLNEPYIDIDNMRYDDFGPEIIPEGRYFMMGDNRNNSKDSRVFGPIMQENIRGKAMFVFWPPDRITGVH
ncbi:signal peptidase I [bacterium]|nr:signal peptidase I [bacterium]MBU1025821.1 signal peptidase I [bacterium]